jgi:hypothetical protein
MIRERYNSNVNQKGHRKNRENVHDKTPLSQRLSGNELFKRPVCVTPNAPFEPVLAYPQLCE